MKEDRRHPRLRQRKSRGATERHDDSGEGVAAQRGSARRWNDRRYPHQLAQALDFLSFDPNSPLAFRSPLQIADRYASASNLQSADSAATEPVVERRDRNAKTNGGGSGGEQFVGHFRRLPRARKCAAPRAPSPLPGKPVGFEPNFSRHFSLTYDSRKPVIRLSLNFPVFRVIIQEYATGLAVDGDRLSRRKRNPTVSSGAEACPNCRRPSNFSLREI